MQPGKSYTVELWFWNGFPTNARPVTGYLFSLGSDKDSEAAGDHVGIGGTLTTASEGKLFFFNGNQLNTMLAGKTELALRSWHHVVLVRDQKHVTVYLDGNGTPEISGDAESSVPNSAEMFIGGRCDNFSNFEGKLDEVAVYDRALFAAEAAQHFQSAGLPAQQEASSSTTPALDSPPLSPADSLKKIHVRPGFEVELVAAEPLLESPVAIDWDERGRLWVVEMIDYPLGLDGKGKPGGRVRILEDTNDDGKYDKTTLVADGLRFPTGIITWREGAIITAAPEIIFLKPANSEKSWSQQVLYSGFFEANQQLRVNGLRWGLDNWVYCANGAHHGAYGTATKIKSTITGELIPIGSRDFRFKPDTGILDPQSGPSQFGRNPDNWGNWFGVQNSWPLWHYVLQDHYIRRNPHVPAPDPVHQVIGPKNPKVFPSGKLEKRFHSFEESGHFTSACAATIYRDNLLFGVTSNMHSFTCEPFHNLVHHGVIEEDGVSFNGHRAPEEMNSEFFSSADRWTRPVMTRTGPDGALWVVDMYRYMIEHPEWLPPQGRAELMPHYRAGEDRGRIYRVFPEGHRPSAPQKLARLTLRQLVAALDSPNGWQRDKVQQMLVWKQDRSAIPLLEKLARNSAASSVSRLHALCTLDGLNALRPELVQQALADPNPGIRIHALRLSETRFNPGILTAATNLVSDSNPKVLLQLACTLGQWNDPSASQALGRLAVANHADKFIIAAVLSSGMAHCPALVDQAVSAGGQALSALSEPLLNLALGLDQRDSVAHLLRPALKPRTAGFELEQMERFSEFLDTLAHRKTSWTDLSKSSSADELSKELQEVPALFAAAKTLATDPARADSERITAAALLARESSTKPSAIQMLAECLTPKTPSPAQRAAIKALGLTGDESVPQVLTKNWDRLGPDTRIAVFDELMSREPWTFALVQRLQEGAINPALLEPVRKDRLLHHHSARVKEIAIKVLNADNTQSRTKVIADFRPALTLTGEPGRGKTIHAKLCAVCHKLGDVGNDVGPNLQSVAAHPPEKLLVSILDPNASIEPGYLAYSCTLANGEELYGIIAAETGNSMIIKMADGKTRTILRRNIASLRSANLSLMPEGLESGMSKQDMADLISFLRTPSHTK
jgi:putative membrane-bound dehydrogenase-like protein